MHVIGGSLLEVNINAGCWYMIFDRLSEAFNHVILGQIYYVFFICCICFNKNVMMQMKLNKIVFMGHLYAAAA